MGVVVFVFPFSPKGFSWWGASYSGRSLEEAGCLAPSHQRRESLMSWDSSVLSLSLTHISHLSENPQPQTLTLNMIGSQKKENLYNRKKCVKITPRKTRHHFSFENVHALFKDCGRNFLNRPWRLQVIKLLKLTWRLSHETVWVGRESLVKKKKKKKAFSFFLIMQSSTSVLHVRIKTAAYVQLFLLVPLAKCVSYTIKRTHLT